MRFLVLFAVLVIIAELALLIYLAVLNKDVLFKFNQPVAPVLPFAWAGMLLPGNITLSTKDDSSAIRYTTTLRINQDLATFNGSMTITFTTHSAMAGLVLHGRDLIVSRALLKTSATETMDAKSISYDEAREYVNLQYPKEVPVGPLQLTVEWSGLVGTGTEGLYRSEYVNEANPTGPKKVLLATQMEPTYARRVFPCFDQPDYRAFWTITVEAPVELATHALGNTELITDPPQQTGNGVVRYDFAKTESAIPAYLLAFIVGDMEYVESTWGDDNKPLRVYFTRPSQRPLAAFALKAARSFMNYFESITKLPYEFKKLDLVAVPDFAAGAMENPGLITFRETALLTDAEDQSASFASRMRVAEVVAHELAHQWYGNTLGPSNWNDLWIAEGSATFWSYQALDAVFPEWRFTQNYFMSYEWVPAMQADELLATSSVYRNVTSPASAAGIFDVTTYSKGASILRQINGTLAVNEMTRSMEEWFKRNVDGASMNTTAYLKVLSSAAGSAARMEVGPNSAPFIFDRTFPVINFTIPVNSTSGQLVASMQSYTAFYLGQPDTTASWNVPLYVQTEAGGVLSNYGVFGASLRNLTIPATLNQAQWYKANPNGIYYYRTQYPITNWERLTTAVAANSPKLNANDRIVLISDAFTFAEIGQLPYRIVFELLTASLKPSETSYGVWQAAMAELLTFDDLLQDQRCFPHFEAMMSSYLTPAYNYWTWDIGQINDTGTPTPVTPTAGAVSLRNLVLSMGAEYITTPEYTSYAIDKVNAYLADPVANPLPLDTAGSILKVAISRGSQGLWLRTWDRYMAASNPTEKTTILGALAWTSSPAMVSTLLKSTLNTDEIRSQDQIVVLRALALNRHAGASRIWLFMRDHFATIVEQFPQNLGSWFSTLSTSTNAHLIQEIGDLLNKDYPQLQIDPSAITETIADNVAWLNQFGTEICQYLTTSFPDIAKRTVDEIESL
jgi:aminopeptidase N